MPTGFRGLLASCRAVSIMMGCESWVSFWRPGIAVLCPPVVVLDMHLDVLLQYPGASNILEINWWKSWQTQFCVLGSHDLPLVRLQTVTSMCGCVNKHGVLKNLASTKKNLNTERPKMNLKPNAWWLLGVSWRAYLSIASWNSAAALVVNTQHVHCPLWIPSCHKVPLSATQYTWAQIQNFICYKL